MAQPLVKKDDDQEDEEYSPFMGIEKGAVLQEARVFNDPQLDARRCSKVITKLLYLLNQGETFTKIEATEVFFSVTKLFQSKDACLRRMVYLMIKELSPSADEVIIVTSSLMKDMNSRTDMYRANAIRVLCRITDGTLLTQIERYLKQAIVDKNPVVASAALVSGIHLLQTNPEIVKRWTNEVQEAVQSRAALVQFHALALLHQIRQNDRLAVSKLVTSLTKGPVRSPLAQCLLIRYTSQVIRESGTNNQGDRPLSDFLEVCLRHKADMVIIEAARAITELNGVTSRELTPAITVLQLFLSSSKPLLRFAAVRTLNKVAMTHPLAVTNCNIDMESLISDQNRSIATLALTTLLKTGNEPSVDRLMKQISNFMSDIADEFKIVVVEAIRSLCLKFPLKHRSLMNFLSNILREEGGFEFKKAIIDSIVILIRDIPEAKEIGLFHLCEFIEDCEFTYLSTQILHFLGNEGPKTSDPSKYIRYIYNRVILENATVRAAAVSTLAKFGSIVGSLKARIFVLLKRCLYDSDDEVRDRATLYLKMLGWNSSAGESDEDVIEFLFGALDVPLINLETSLQSYEPSEEPFNISAVPKVVKPQPLTEKKAPGKTSPSFGVSANGHTSTLDAYEKLLSSIPQFSSFGLPFKSSAPVELTEAETEYAVNVVKHIYDGHVVFQYNCTNTIPEQLLENVTVIVDASEAEEFAEVALKPLKALPYDSPGQTFVAFQKPDGLSTGRFSNLLKFVVKEVDPATGEAEEGVEDEYQLEDLEVVAADYILRVPVLNFKNDWDSMGPYFERVDEYGLGVRESLAEAVNAVINLLGMQPCEVAMTHPLAVTSCNIDMESLISDQNRSIATLALTTLLKTGNESSVDRLMKQISNFMSDIADEFKIVVVEAIRSLCLKFPLKHRSLMNFLSNILREEGGFEFKKAIIDSIVILIRDIPEAKEIGLFHLCEFIEDCEFTYLSTQILHFLGNEGPKTSDPSKYIRYIYNRVILENATVRAAAVSTLAKFGSIVGSLKARIFVLLKRCLYDSDDEVRDRATLYLKMLGWNSSAGESDEDVIEFLFGALDVPLINLETSLQSYEPSEEPFNISAVPKVVKPQPLTEKKAPGKTSPSFGVSANGHTSTLDAYEKLLSSIPQFSSFGLPFKSSAPVELTEAETEYAVNVVKHIYDGHVVFQYNCTNTIPEQLLENVTVIVDASEAEEFAEVALKPLKALPYDSPGQTFVAFQKPDGLSTGRFSNLLKFVVKEVDPATGEAEEGVEDEYQLEDLEVVAADYILRVPVLNFKNDWDSMGPYFERVDEYGLGVRESLAEAVNAVINLLGMQPCEGTEVVPNNARSHTCLLSGVFIGNVKVLVRLSFGIDGPKQVAMKLAVRSEDAAISDAIHEIVANG